MSQSMGELQERAAEPHRRMDTWKVVALTLGSVLLAGLIFIAGLVTGVTISDVPGGSSATGGTGGSNDSGGDGARAIDSCLVGTWHTQSYEQRATGDQGESVLTGLVRTFTFDASGKHVVTYDTSKATMDVAGEKSQLIFDGTVNYTVSVSGKTMSFTLSAVKGSVTVVAPNGSTKEQELKPGTGDVTYSCEGDTYTEESKGYREVATRVT